jgi:hypothetical protein
MKFLLVLALLLNFAFGLSAQGAKTVNLATAGTLSTVLTSDERNTITSLTITGNIDALDFKTMRDEMHVAVLNLSSVTIVAYNGTEGTSISNSVYPDSTIPEAAFYKSDMFSKSSLMSIVLPSNVTSIGEYAFFDCFALNTIVIPSSMTSIGDFAFGFCNTLKTILLPSFLTQIGDHAFFGCNKLTTVVIPASVTSVGTRAFNACSGFISVDTDNPNYSGIDGVLYDKTQTLLIQCPISKIESFTIPTSVTSIGAYAFYSSGLNTVKIPSSITSIAEGAFNNSSELTSIITSSPTPVDLSSSLNVFSQIDKRTCTLYVPIGSKSAYQSADQWKDFTNIVEKDPTVIDPISNDHQLIIYPNPTSGKIKIAFDRVPQAGIKLIVTDLTGKVVVNQVVQEKVNWIDLSGNTPGIYLVKTNLPNSTVQKVILQ